MNLADLRPVAGATHHKKRLGAGTGSGHGKTSGRGTKGQRARRRGEYTPTFEGGQTPFVKRMPYRRGFRNALFKKRFEVIDLDVLESLPANSVVTLESLTTDGIIRPRFAGLGPFCGLKVLGSGTLTKSLTVHAAKFSKSAKARVEELGGTAEELGENNPQPKQF
ncbi:MAG: 50S ribosomal protein L15 [Chloroflexi bacterium]|nr:50S ribosomal protein L15 [Chloroflexota bacterium]